MYEIRDLVPSDAPSLARCFRRAYGDSYPVASFYDAEATATRLSTGELRSVGAVDAEGEVVAHTALRVQTDGAIVVEAGNTIVDPGWRKQGLLAELGVALGMRCARDGFAGFVHYPTTAHATMQHASVRDGGVEVGVMIGYVPAETDYRELDRAPGRLAATIAYQPTGSGPALTSHLPERYRPILAGLFDRAGLERQLRPSDAGAVEALSHRTRLGASLTPSEGVMRIELQAAGRDLAEALAELAGHQQAVTLLDISLTCPGSGWVAEVAAAQGYVFSGLLPGFGSGDVLRLQKLDALEPGDLKVTVANEGARDIADWIAAERGVPAG